MSIYVYNENQSGKEQVDGAYWERNMLALFIAMKEQEDDKSVSGYYKDIENNWDGWHRVISLFDGKITFHIPDDFDIGNLPEIDSNWDGHTTEEKWKRVMKYCGCKIEK